MTDGLTDSFFNEANQANWMGATEPGDPSDDDYYVTHLSKVFILLIAWMHNTGQKHFLNKTKYNMRILKIFFLCLMVWGIPYYSFAQRKISGQVLSELNDPLVGVTIVVEGTLPKEITTTDSQGRFTLTTSKGAFLVTYIGYKNQTITIGDKTQFTIKMEPDNQDLDDVVVVGYGKQSKRNITGAVSNLKAEDVVRTSSTSTASALAGKVQGVSVRAKDARPGRGAGIEIRNMGNPLFVIDGVALWRPDRY